MAGLPAEDELIGSSITQGEFRNGLAALRAFLDTGDPAPEKMMEYGSNANGSYIRFADGTQICWKIQFVIYLDSIYPQYVMYSVWTFPATFSNIDYCINESFCGLNNALLEGDTGVANENGYGIPFNNHDNVSYAAIGIRSNGGYATTSGIHAYVDAFAIGRWY